MRKLAQKENLSEAEQLRQRKHDIALVSWIINNWDETVERHDKRVIIDFKRLLDSPPREGANRFGILTTSQRGLALAVAKRVDREFTETMLAELEDPTERNKNVPRGKHVPIPPVLQQLPLKPPGHGGGVRIVR